MIVQRSGPDADQLAAAGELIEIFDDDVEIENNVAIVEDQHRQLLQGRDL